MKFLSKLQNYLSISLLVFLLIFIFSSFYKKKLPDLKTALPELKNDPIQTPTSAQKFAVKAGDKEYEITPLYNYELYGMIVSSGDNLGLFSRFKDRDPLNANDLCVLWGSNVFSGIYQQMSFRTEEWVCWSKFNGEYNDYPKFTHNKLSNNHLLANAQVNSKLYETIRSAKIGDQIHFKGYLASYAIKGWFDSDSGQKSDIFTEIRSSSTTRDDGGDGSCETVYVTDFEIIKKYGSLVLMASVFSKYFLIYGVIAWIVLFIVSLIIPSRYQRPEEIILSQTENLNESLPINITKKKAYFSEPNKQKQ